MSIGRRMAWVVVSLGWSAAAFGQLSPGLVRTTTQISDSARLHGEAMAQLYLDALRREINFTNVTEVEALERKLKQLVDENAAFIDGSLAAREAIAAEAEALEAAGPAVGEIGRARLEFLYAQYEQILIAAPMEPLNVCLRILFCIPKNEKSRVYGVLFTVRDQYAELRDVGDLRSIMPGGPQARANFNVLRYRMELRCGGPRKAVEVPPAMESTDAVPMAVEPHLPVAPPLSEWKAFVAARVQRLGLTGEAAAAADAVLRDVMERAEAYREAAAPVARTIEGYKDAEQRAAQLRDLNRPIDKIFEELKQRLLNLAPPSVTF